MAQKKNVTSIDPQSLKLNEEKLPLPFCNLLRIHVDIFHAQLIFGYFNPNKKGNPELVGRVAMPLQTLVNLRDMINKVISNMEKDGAIEFVKSPLISPKKENL